MLAKCIEICLLKWLQSVIDPFQLIPNLEDKTIRLFCIWKVCFSQGRKQPLFVLKIGNYWNESIDKLEKPKPDLVKLVYLVWLGHIIFICWFHSCLMLVTKWIYLVFYSWLLTGFLWCMEILKNCIQNPVLPKDVTCIFDTYSGVSIGARHQANWLVVRSIYPPGLNIYSRGKFL